MVVQGEIGGSGGVERNWLDSMNILEIEAELTGSLDTGNEKKGFLTTAAQWLSCRVKICAI